jgi:acyl-CoA synthetase (AMP-forming)/AMP-acid ligase II
MSFATSARGPVMIFRSPYPDVQIPNVPLTPFVLRHATRLADKPAIVDGLTGHGFTYGELAAAVRTVASALAERGLRKGDVLAIYAPNSPEYAVAFHAVVSLGGIVTTVNPAATSEELAYQLNDAGAAYLLTASESLDRAVAAAAQSPVRELFVFGDIQGYTSFSTLLVGAGVLSDVQIDPSHDLAALPYSSGTTGLPKGVMQTHANLVANVAQLAGSQTVSEHDTLIGLVPFFHSYGLTVLMNYALAVGATIVTLPRFEIEQFLQTVESYGVTFAPLAPPTMVTLAKHPAVDNFDLSRLQVIVSGGAPLGVDVTNACRTRVGCHVKQGFGLTEASPVTHICPTGLAESKTGSIGQLLANTECRIVDPESAVELGPDQPGELWIRGPQIMKGYLNRPEATELAITPDGWLRTGDLGFADSDGFFTIVDRLKEMIKYKAHQVAPAELEAMLLSHPAVADAAVIPSPNEETGEVPKAYVVLRGDATEDELMAYVAARVAPYKKIRRLEFIDQIPKSASGKILRRILVERERAAMLVLA